MPTNATAEFNLAKAKSIGGDMADWEFADKKGAGKSAVKDVKAATGVVAAKDK